MNLLTAILTFIAIAVPPAVEAVAARRRLERAVVTRGWLPEPASTGLPPGTPLLERVRLVLVSWRPPDPTAVDLAFDDLERRKQVQAMGRELPEGRSARRWTTAALLLWVLGLPLAVLLLPTADRLVGLVLPAALEVIRVPLVLALGWAAWFGLRRWRAARR